MNGFLLDTSVVSELRKRDRCTPKVSAWARTVPPNQDFLSVLVVGELRRGATLKRRRDPASARAMDEWDHATGPTVQRPDSADHLGNRPRVGTTQRVATHSAGGWFAGDDRTRASTDLRHAERAHIEGLGISVLDPWKSH